jgi:hypothetical protein
VKLTRIILEKTNLKAKSSINSTLKEEIGKKNNNPFFLKKKKEQVNSSQSTKFATQIMHTIKFNKFFIPNIIFHLIDLYENKMYVNFFCMICFLK